MDTVIVHQGPRRYKSRLNRPCDLCRSRKIACRIDTIPPCAFCLARGSPCTFLKQPRDRPRQTRQEPPFPSESVSQSGQHADQAYEEDAFASDPASSARLLQDSGHLNRFLLRSSDVSLLQRSVPGSTLRQVTLGATSTTVPDVFEIKDTDLSTSGEPPATQTPLDSLKREVSNIITVKQGERLLTLYFNYVYHALPILSRSWFFSSKSAVQARLHSLPPSLLASLYATALPFIFHDEYLNSTLSAAIAPISSIRDDLYRISWQAIITEAHVPSLSTLQACLFLLQCGPTNQYRSPSPFRPALTKFAVSLASSLGLHRDCSSCTSLPLWERRLRLRLWWTTYITDVWTGIEFSTVGSIRTDEFDVPLPQPSSGIRDVVMNVPQGCDQFCWLVHLTQILSDIQTSFYTVKATQQTCRDLFHSLKIARPIHARLVDWKSQHLTPENTDDSYPINGTAIAESPSLSLCYYAVTVTVFRALMRPLEDAAAAANDAQLNPEAHSSATSAVITGALTVAGEALTFIEQTVALRSPWNSFWYSWAQMNFANVTMFALQLNRFGMPRRQLDGFTVSVTRNAEGDDGFDDVDDYTGPLGTASQRGEQSLNDTSDLIRRWRQAIRLGVGSGGWGSSLMSLALLRMDAFLSVDSVDLQSTEETLSLTN